MALQIRTARRSDTGLIHELIRELAVFERLEKELVGDREALEMSLFGPEAVPKVLIAEWNGNGVGFALFFFSYSTFLARPGIYLEDLFVRPEFRSCGIGEALLRKIAQLAVERGCGRLEWSVLDWNKEALRFYHRLGAVPMQDWTVQRLSGKALEELATR